MSRSALRVLIAVGMLVSVGLMFAPSWWARSAQAQPGGADSAALVNQATDSTVVGTTIPVVTLPPARPTTTQPSPGGPVSRTTRLVTSTSRARVSATSSSTTSSSTTTTTIKPITGSSTPTPVTLPLASEPQSANINPIFPILSVIGFATLLVLVGAQAILTRPGSNGPTL